MPGSARCRCPDHTERVDLLVPVKALARAKSRLRGAADRGRATHAELVLAMLSDTLRAALAAGAVRRVLVVTCDPDVSAAAQEHGAQVLPDHGGDLNTALAEAAKVLRVQDGCTVVGALQADLPALDPHELSAAVRSAAGRPAFCPDRDGIGTTLLLSGHALSLRPRFGPGSASRHASGGAVALLGPWPSLTRDVDTPEDLVHAAQLGLGPSTRAALRTATGLLSG